MAIFRCNKCSHLREVGNDYVGKVVKCPKCDNVTTIYETVAFIQALIKKHIALTKELHDLRKELSENFITLEAVEDATLEGVDIHNTNIFAQDHTFAPIIQWFENRKIKVQINPNAVDTTGFFDEIALMLGTDFSVLNHVSNQIKYIQNKGYQTVKIELSKKSEIESQRIASFCKTLYDYSFVAKYQHQKKDQNIYLTLQTAPKIRDFFNGIWMEWFALVKLLEFFRENKATPAISRNVEISFSEGNSYELDIFLLAENGVPICVECKTGEFRQDINKYLSLRKQLKIESSQFVICVFGLSQEQAQGMTSMYELTFVNEKNFIDHIKTVI